MFVDRVEVDDNEIRIRGRKTGLVQGLAIGLDPVEGPVPSSAQKWRAKANESENWVAVLNVPAHSGGP